MPKYVSSQRLEDIKRELDERRNIKRKEIARRIEEAKSLGDLSENAEYMEAREEQAFNEGKIQELEEIIREAVVIEDEKNGDTDVVGIGDVVEAKREDGTQQTFTIVGSNEADPLKGKISNESPLGKAFLDRRPGETIEIVTPAGKTRYTIIKVS